jgi:hypothetical protein
LKSDAGILTVDIGTGRRPTHPLHRSKTISTGDIAMTASLMNKFDRALMSFVVVLGALPMLAVAAGAAI